jgi:threonine/homoserine/homoserine lactone efflux protein
MRTWAVTFRQGLVAGFLLYVTVALFFVGLNLLTERPLFHTVELLGEPLLGRRPLVPGPEWRWAARLTFNGVHFLASLALGVGAALVARGADHSRRGRWIFFFVLVVGSAVVILALQVLTAEARLLLPWHTVVSAHLAGAITTTGYLLWTRQPPVPGDAEDRSSG